MSGLTQTSEQSPEIEFWFEFGSNYSYLSVMRIEDEARRRGVWIAWKPFLLGPIFALGLSKIRRCAAKGEGRLCLAGYGAAVPQVRAALDAASKFPRLGVLPLRVALLGAERPWIGAFCRQVMELNWALDQDINQPEPWRVYWRS